EIGPKWHEKKQGTPTMGGLAFLFAVFCASVFGVLFLYLSGDHDGALSLSVNFAFAFANATVGVVDDLTKLHRHKNEGLTPTEKLIFQFAIAIGFLLLRRTLLGETTTVAFAFGHVDLGFFYYPICLLLLVGIINFANLTDGIDGLAASVAFGIGVSLFYISAALSGEVSFLAATMMGASMGFLFFNLHPAKIFMGDTGSLFFGALAASSVFSLGNPLLILPIGGVYILEGLSVVLQVLFFKMTKRRLFRMAPLHHHFEKCGWPENRICLAAIFLTLLFSLPAYILYLP
ncbi:MAG TPA: phospho-N-acetylmuramoyl-pentapeptide-transferase, partial [Clostridiales bacterium]|nr:phospho-N-acetylmuramoyl-pentapeptide-transferase [Clostridiales bacterium]